MCTALDAPAEIDAGYGIKLGVDRRGTALLCWGHMTMSMSTIGICFGPFGPGSESPPVMHFPHVSWGAGGWNGSLQPAGAGWTVWSPCCFRRPVTDLLGRLVDGVEPRGRGRDVRQGDGFAAGSLTKEMAATVSLSMGLR